ncbi:MAG TPA: YvcK family protein, partial [Actinobacteria bacterium]|nr:YvcK family protein [Actinomycetota bacterium]
VMLARKILRADDGGSSGQLRRELQIVPPGDSRNCLVAMANGTIMSDLFQYRFPRGEGLKAHAVGNLIIAALAELTGDFSVALVIAGNLLGARGRVLPATLEPLTLWADVEAWSDSSEKGRVIGQCNVANRLRPLKSLGIIPENIDACPEAVRALESADTIILGPGSLFTSILPNLLVREIAETIKRSSARKIFLANITVQPGETDHFTAADHVRALLSYGPGICDQVVTSNTLISKKLLSELEKARSSPLVVDDKEITGLGVAHLPADLTDEDSPTHHQSQKLAAFLRGAI